MINGHGPSPDAGSVTLTSSGTPSKLGTRVATEPSQNRVPSRGTQVSFPNDLAGSAAAGLAATPMAAIATNVITRARPSGTGGVSPGFRPACSDTHSARSLNR